MRVAVSQPLQTLPSLGGRSLPQLIGARLDVEELVQKMQPSQSARDSIQVMPCRPSSKTMVRTNSPHTVRHRA